MRKRKKGSWRCKRQISKANWHGSEDMGSNPGSTTYQLVWVSDFTTLSLILNSFKKENFHKELSIKTDKVKF